MSLQRKPSIVFVHGLWADGSCFSKLIPTLQKEGFEVIASQHGLDSHAGDVDCVKRTLGRVSNPAILVGHSYGGSVITATGTDPRVAALVYVAAFAPDARLAVGVERHPRHHRVAHEERDGARRRAGPRWVADRGRERDRLPHPGWVGRRQQDRCRRRACDGRVHLLGEGLPARLEA